MTNIRLTPERHQVFNEFDRNGILLGLSRLSGETNAAYKQRLLDIFVNRSNSTYRGLINGITRELGLSISEAIRVRPVYSGSATVATMPAIVFQDTKCYLYEDFANDDILLTIDRFDTDSTSWSISELISTINGTGKYYAELLDNNLASSRSMTIFNQSSIETIPSEDISSAGGRYHLANTNLVAGSVGVTSSNLKKRVSAQSALRRNGDYYIDLEHGILYAVGQAAPGSTIRYQYRNDDFIVLSSPVIIHDLQSADFQTKMFNQVTDGEGSTINSTPTKLGANIINELLSVFPTSWGR